MSLYDALLKTMPNAAIKLKNAGTGYGDITGNSKTLAGATRTNLVTNPCLGVNATGWNGPGGTRVAQGAGYAFQMDGSVATTPYAPPVVGTVGQFWSGSVVVSGPAGKTVNVRIHDGTGFNTPAIVTVLTGTPQTIPATCS